MIIQSNNISTTATTAVKPQSSPIVSGTRAAKDSDTVTISAAAIEASQISASSSESSTTGGFTNMTPNRMQGAAQDLYKSGKIDLTQLHMLQTAGVPLGRQGPHGEFIPLTASEKASYSNNPVNYVQLTKGAMAFLEQTGSASDPKSGYEQWKGILAALQDTAAA